MVQDNIKSFSLQTWDNQTFDFKADGKKATLFIFWATWCKPCLEEVPILKEVRNTLDSSKFQLLSINVDENPKEVVEKFKEKYQIDYPILIGNNKIVEEIAGNLQLPVSVLIGPDGKKIWRKYGLKPKIELLEAISPHLMKAGS